MQTVTGSHRQLAAAALAVLLLAAGAELRGFTITEIHYDPPGENTGAEFIEIHNETPTIADLSGWSFTEGVAATFPRGTFVPGKGYAVVAANAAVFTAAHGFAPAAVFTGRLDSTGETLVLSANGGREVVRVKYDNRGKWTSIPAGTGHTLALRNPYLDPSEPESWEASREKGGTPGRANFPAGGFNDDELVPAGAVWTYAKGTAEFSNPGDAWRRSGFAATGWLTGPAGIGYGDGDDATVLDDMPNNYFSVAARRTFILSRSRIDSLKRVFLGIRYDDGFVAYLNGTEVARSFVPGVPGTAVPFNAPAVDPGHEAGAEEEFEVPISLLATGQNVLAIQGHNVALTSTDFSLHARLVGRKDNARVVFNEFLGRTAGDRWLEIHNPNLGPLDLSGHHLAADARDLAGYRIPDGTVVPAGGFLTIAETAAGLDFGGAEARLFLSEPGPGAVIAAGIFALDPADGAPGDRAGFSDARVPDGSPNWGYAATPTPGAPNTLTVEGNGALVLNEIFYPPPLGNTHGEFIELHNRGAIPIDAGGWSFTRGIAFTIPDGTVIPDGGFLVIAQDPPALAAAHGIAGILGPWEGNLADGGEAVRLVDRAGNTVDELRYHDGGQWPEWADGGGSSLELIDPSQDNSFATAWEASHEAEKAEWTRVSYSGAVSRDAESEVHFILLDGGVILIDDVSLTRQGAATEHIPNGGFETDTVPWLILGNHHLSRRTTLDAHSGSACLELRASGSGDTGVNKVETDTSPGMANGTHTLSFWAKWQGGANALLTRADSRTNASLSRTTRLPLPPALGTPGRENSARIALRLAAGSDNLGPVIGDVTQVPVAPGPASAVTVLARASDSDGVASLTLHWRTGGLGDGVFTAVAMADGGASGDGRAGDELFGGTIPPQPLGTRVVFYLEGADAVGNSRRFPLEAPARTLLYCVEPAAGTTLHVVRLDFDQEREAELTGRLLHSDDLLDGTFVFNDQEIYYNVGVRYRGSPWNRPPDPKMFRVRFPEDKPFLRGMKAINLSRWGWAQNEGTAFFCVQGASVPQSPGPVGDYHYAQVYRNASLHSGAPMTLVEPVNGGHVASWFPADPDGYLFKIPARRYLNDAGQLESADFTTFAYRPVAPGYEYEAYRWYFIPSSRELEDRWTEINELCSVLDVNRSPTTGFEARVLEVLDVEQFLRVEAARTLQDDWDTIGIGNGQNAYIYYAPREGRWKLFAWDMDHTFGNVDAKLYPEGSEAQVTRLVQRPAFRRMYLRIVEEILAGPWDPAYLGQFLTATGAVTGASGQGILDFVNARRPAAAALIPAGVRFAVTTVAGRAVAPDWNGEHTTANTSERVRGSAPVALAIFTILRDGDPVDLPVNWVSTTVWDVNLPLDPGDNLFEILGFSDAGHLLGSVSFRIVSTAGWPPPVITAVEPDHGPAAGGTRVRITGSWFQPGARITFGGVEGTQVTIPSRTEAQATTPPGEGKVVVIIENPDLQGGSLTGAFQYLSAPEFVRGDATGDQRLDISDPIRTLGYLFLGEELSCADAADANDSGTLDISDGILVLNFLFLAGPEPAPPFPAPGADPLDPADLLGCDR